MQLDIAKHIVEHAIVLRQTNGGGSGSRPAEFKVLRTPNISANGTVYPITSNTNGSLGKSFSTAKIQTSGFQVTGVDLKPIYNSTNVFTRTRIKPQSYEASTGKLTLSAEPISDFIIHYRYFIDSDDYVENYIPNDIVVGIEAEYNQTQIAKKVAFDHASKGLITDTDIQAAIDTILVKLYDGVEKQSVIANQPVESPNGSRTIFTIPNSQQVRGSNIEVKLNGVAYDPANITVINNGTQFQIINADHTPKASDSFTITYDRRL